MTIWELRPRFGNWGALTRARGESELPPIFQTPRLGAMMISEVWDGKRSESHHWLACVP
jgi:hypothetical protein